ncbi:MAG: FAD:protein FMN transferase [Tardiphaga sp.]
MTAAAPRVAIPLQLSARALPARARLQRLGGETMGTSWSVTFAGTAAAAQTLNRAIGDVLDRVIAQMSPWLPDSDISRFNHCRHGEWQTLPAEFAEVIATALRIASLTNGACDPTMGMLVDCWGFGATPSSGSLPDAVTLSPALQSAGWQRLTFDHATRRLRRATDCRLDLNGIAKGFAVDLVMATLRRHGIHHALVEIGGELSGAGIKPDGTPWWVTVDRPVAGRAVDAARPLLVALHGLAIATSGCERGVTIAGQRFSHTIDPRTGMPIDNGMLTATVLHASCMDADAYATALMVMGADAGMAFAEQHGLAATILFTADSGDAVERVSPALKAMLS